MLKESSGLYRISENTLSQFHLNPDSSSKTSQSANGMRNSVSVENLNELIAQQPEFTDAYDCYDKNMLEVVEVEVIADDTSSGSDNCPTPTQVEKF